MSMFSTMMQSRQRPKRIRFLYASKVADTAVTGSKILFLSRLIELVKQAQDPSVKLEVFLTGTTKDKLGDSTGLPERTTVGRIGNAELDSALGDETKRSGTLCYVCGPPRMTDTIVDYLKSCNGMDEHRVLCEKWW